MKAVVRETGIVLAREVELAQSFKQRLVGLMFRKSLPAGAALLLDPCNMVHTCFMRFNMDALFLDKDGRVLHVTENMKPWRQSPLVWGAKTTLELPGGALDGRVEKGQHVVFEK